MQNAYDSVTLLQQVEIFSIIKTIILIVAGFVVARFTTNAAKRILASYTSSQQLMLLQKLIYFSILIIFVVAAFQQLGFKLSVLLGSAGIATAAIAFASQTSISNIISGIFLIMEKSFQIGDRVKIGNTTGTVTSIDLLSVKLLTAQNTMVRVPNEALIKSEITNITRFESRRLDLTLRIPQEENIDNMKDLLLQIAGDNPLSLKTPFPTATIQEIDSSEVYLQLSVWVGQKNYDALKDSLYMEVMKMFRQHEIPL